MSIFSRNKASQIYQYSQNNIWRKIEESLSVGDSIQEGHFAERSWANLLSYPLSKKEIDLLLYSIPYDNMDASLDQSNSQAIYYGGYHGYITYTGYNLEDYRDNDNKVEEGESDDKSGIANADNLIDNMRNDYDDS